MLHCPHRYSSIIFNLNRTNCERGVRRALSEGKAGRTPLVIDLLWRPDFVWRGVSVERKTVAQLVTSDGVRQNFEAFAKAVRRAADDAHRPSGPSSRFDFRRLFSHSITYDFFRDLDIEHLLFAEEMIKHYSPAVVLIVSGNVFPTALRELCKVLDVESAVFEGVSLSARVLRIARKRIRETIRCAS